MWKFCCNVCSITLLTNLILPSWFRASTEASIFKRIVLYLCTVKWSYFRQCVSLFTQNYTLIVHWTFYVEESHNVSMTFLFVIKPIRCTNFTNLFCHETLHVSDSSSVHHQEFIHCTLSNGICHTGLQRAFEQDQDGTAVPSWSCSKVVYKPVWHIPFLSV